MRPRLAALKMAVPRSRKRVKYRFAARRVFRTYMIGETPSGTWRNTVLRPPSGFLPLAYFPEDLHTFSIPSHECLCQLLKHLMAEFEWDGGFRVRRDERSNGVRIPIRGELIQQCASPSKLWIQRDVVGIQRVLGLSKKGNAGYDCPPVLVL